MWYPVRHVRRATADARERGGVSEWLKEAVLKTVVPKGTVGSNPTASARESQSPDSLGALFVATEFNPIPSSAIKTWN